MDQGKLAKNFMEMIFYEKYFMKNILGWENRNNKLSY